MHGRIKARVRVTQVARQVAKTHLVHHWAACSPPLPGPARHRRAAPDCCAYVWMCVCVCGGARVHGLHIPAIASEPAQARAHRQINTRQRYTYTQPLSTNTNTNTNTNTHTHTSTHLRPSSAAWRCAAPSKHFCSEEDPCAPTPATCGEGVGVHISKSLLCTHPYAKRHTFRVGALTAPYFV